MGCGGITGAWFNATKTITDLEYVGLVDLDPEAAQKRRDLRGYVAHHWRKRMAEAQGNDTVRDAESHYLARYVGKVRTLVERTEWMELYGRSLSVERQLELYASIRDCNPHRESEFRSQFEQFFPHCVAFLPDLKTPIGITLPRKFCAPLQGDFDVTCEDLGLENENPFESD